MSVGYVPEFFSKFKSNLFSTIQIPVPNKYRLPNNYSFSEYQNYCLNKLEKLFSQNNSIAAFVMESGAQVAGGVIIYPKGFQSKISKICKKHNVLLVLDEIETAFNVSITLEETLKIENVGDFKKILKEKGINFE